MPASINPFDHLARVGDWTHFALRATLAGVASVPRVGLWVKPLYGVLIGGLPLAAVLGLALGAVIWMHTRGVLERTAGASELLPTVLAAAVLLELAPVGAGLIVASRTGASLGAELASMRLGEQVDALELLGVSPMRRLVAPRVLACVLAVPMLHALVATLAIGGGYAAELVAGHTTWLKYRAAVVQELRLHEVVPAGLKTLVFGALIGATGCYIGFHAKGGSEGVGKAATDSVVACSLLVLVADVLLVGLIRAFG
jgi:phospholipid/cholesterol/gamma-HCH transport system permease protein